VPDWFDSHLGQAVQAAEQEAITGVMKKLHNPFWHQVLVAGRATWLEELPAVFKYHVIPPSDVNTHPNAVFCQYDALPFPANSIDVLALGHVVEFVEDPLTVLKQCYQVSAPYGYLFLTGFNALSLMGVMRMFHQRDMYPEVPWCGQFITPNTIQKLLQEVGYEVLYCRTVFHQLPKDSDHPLAKTNTQEMLGSLWLPTLGAAVIVVAQKREVGVRFRERSMAAEQNSLAQEVLV